MSVAVRGPAQPVYILRGHNAQIHALHFYNGNLRLLTGDADGWVVFWSLVSRRPIAVWRAHEKSILTLCSWTGDRIITHGRDDALRVWHIPASAEATLSKALPADGYDVERQSPWLLHSLLVNTMNFCSFGACHLPVSDASTSDDKEKLLLAVPSTQDGYVHIHELPSEKCIHIVPPASTTTKSLIMAIKLYSLEDRLYLITGNEAGETSVQLFDHEEDQGSKSWQTLYSARPHSQPILSLDMAPSQSRYFTSSADAIIASHPLPTASNTNSALSEDEMAKLPTGHAGQQSLVVRDDSRIFATAGWDARVRVYSAKSLKEVAVLKWHKEGCYSVAFGTATASSSSSSSSGSDSNMPVREIADVRHPSAAVGDEEEKEEEKKAEEGQALALRPSAVSLTVQQRREQKTRTTHWLAAGSKDGKVSLWNIF